MIDPKDLQPLNIKEFQVGGVFYLKTGDKFEQCVIKQEDIKRDGERLRAHTVQLAKEKRLFIRVNAPWAAFE